MKIKSLILSFLIFATSLVFAQDGAVSFTASVSKDKLGVNERLRIDFKMNKDGDNFTPPDFDGFQILMGPNQSISQQWVNGKASFSKTYSYILAPNAKGSFIIKQATIEIEGQTYKTTPIKIQVTDAVDQPSMDKSADQIADDKVHLVAEVSNGNPYLNEATTVVYKLYFGPDISITNFEPLDNPKYNNFWSQDIPLKRLVAEDAMYEGKRYRAVVLKRVVLYPQKSGKLAIEPLALKLYIEVPTNKRDFFGMPIMNSTTKTVTAGKRTIDVKPLPTEGKPADFTGAVGQFDFNLITNKTSLKAGESLEAKLQIKGNGNLKLFNIPKLSIPSSLEVYDPEHNENVNTDLSGMHGTISDDYTIVPQYKGKYPIPSMTFSYFDPEAKKYKTLSTQQTLINVLEGPNNVSAPVTASNDSAATNTYKQAVQAPQSQFKFIKLKTTFKNKNREDFLGSTLFYILLLCPLLLIPIAIFAFKKKQAIDNDVAGNKIKRANKLAKKYLSEAKRMLGKKEAFYEALERALHNYLKAKLKIETSEFSKDKIRDLLHSKGVDEITLSQFISLLESCEMARYSQASRTEMQNDYDKAADTISQIDKQIKR
ncbi:BatD family protein [Zhouia sp. PK063]|uniref:BatD family protein n=1 Tax=Zhouia sp. PK063 TaxID=3373602 RepID=UPI00379D9620